MCPLSKPEWVDSVLALGVDSSKLHRCVGSLRTGSLIEGYAMRDIAINLREDDLVDISNEGILKNNFAAVDARWSSDPCLHGLGF